MRDIKAILLYASVAENEFFTRTRSLKARKAARSTNTRRPTQLHTHRHIHTDTHKHARLATSPALGSASICQFPVSNKMDGWRMEIMVETQPHTLASFHCERAPLHSATTLMPRGPPPPRYSTLRSPVSSSYAYSPFPKYKYIFERSICYIYYIYNIFSAVYNYLVIINYFIYLQLYIS